MLETWSDVVLHLSPSTPISRVKQLALDAAHIDDEPSRFLVKFRGAEVRDESRSLSDEQVPPEGAMIVMRGHRMPVR
ncbi:MAG: hypothetical protein ACREK8_07795 [Gemmatimonadales bacterium]